MKIKTKILVVNALLLTATLVVGALLLLSYRRIPLKLEQSEQIHHIVREVFTLEVALKEYRFLRLRRAARQWDASMVRLEMYMHELERDLVDPQLSATMQETREEIDELFGALPPVPVSIPSPLEQRISDHIETKLQDMLLWSQMLAFGIHVELEDAHRRANVMVLSFAAGVVFVMFGLQAFFRRTVLLPLGTLERGARRIGRGDFEHSITPEKDDEIGHLTGVLNEMSTDLRQLTQAREEFISAAIHEIKTPVAVIKTSVQFMQELPSEERERRLPQTLARLDRQCNRLDRLVSDVLEVTRLDLRQTEIRRRRTDVADLLQQVVSEVQNLSPRHRIILADVDAVEAMIDADRIEQVLFNLFDNAIKYSPFGGEVEVSMYRQARTFVISVRDRGIGIPADKQRRVFERFYRAHAGTRYEHSASLGVGLYLSREFVRRHGGRMWFESKEGEGSTFHVSLPIDEPTRKER